VRVECGAYLSLRELRNRNVDDQRGDVLWRAISHQQDDQALVQDEQSVVSIARRNKTRTRMKKILIVSCRFDEDRTGGSRPWRVPQAMAPAFLAGEFNPKLCEVRLYSELYSGPLANRDLLAWPDMLVLSGLQVDFDRFLHLTAYARTLNPRVVVVAGGSLIEVLPAFSRRFFDYCCAGPVEEIRDVIRDVFGSDHLAETSQPRYDLAYWSKGIGLVESSRYCNFHCSFCTMSIRKLPYTNFDPEHVRRQILSTKRKRVFFLDNNFYGNNIHQFENKL